MVNYSSQYGIRFVNIDEAERFIHQVSREVKRRLDNIGMLGRSLTLKVLKRSPSAPIEPPKVCLMSLPSDDLTLF